LGVSYKEFNTVKNTYSFLSKVVDPGGGYCIISILSFIPNFLCPEPAPATFDNPVKAQRARKTWVRNTSVGYLVKKRIFRQNEPL